MESFERKETKYLLTPVQYRRFLDLAQAHLAPAEHPEGDVSSLYYDTPDYLLINRSLARPKYKEKLRVRSYGAAQADSTVYVEIKKKFKGIVYKRRVNCTLSAARAFLSGLDYEDAVTRWPLASAEAQEESLCWKSLQVAGEIAWLRDHYEGLAPAMMVSTHRTSFVGIGDSDLRVTVDADVSWKSVADGETAAHALFENDERILEIKCADAYPLWLVDVLDACGIRPQSVSKYGRAYQAATALGLAQPATPLPLAVPLAGMPAAAPAARRISPVAAPAANHRGIAAAVPAAAAASTASTSRRWHLRLPRMFPRHAVA